MSILILAEHDNAVLNAATLNSVTAALEIGGDIDLLVAGKDCATVADQAAQVANVRKVLHADDNAYEFGLAENIALLVACLLYTSPSPRDRLLSRMPSSA